MKPSARGVVGSRKRQWEKATLAWTHSRFGHSAMCAREGKGGSALFTNLLARAASMHHARRPGRVSIGVEYFVPEGLARAALHEESSPTRSSASPSRCPGPSGAASSVAAGPGVLEVSRPCASPPLALPVARWRPQCFFRNDRSQNCLLRAQADAHCHHLRLGLCQAGRFDLHVCWSKSSPEEGEQKLSERVPSKKRFHVVAQLFVDQRRKSATNGPG